MQRRVRVRHDGQKFFVDLPQYNMIPGTFLPVIAGVTTTDGVLPKVDPNNPHLNGLSVVVDIPSRILDPATGKIDKAKINLLYRGQPKWGDVTYDPRIES